MKEPVFNHLDPLRAGRSGCPSDLVLDRLVAQELPAEQATRTREHLSACPACAEQVRLGRFDAWPQVDAASLLARIRQGADAPRGRWERLGQRLHRLWPRQGPLLALAGTLSAVALLAIAPKGPVNQGPSTVAPRGLREKGGPLLHVHRMIRDGSQEVLSGAALAPGERLRFSVDLPRDGYVTIVGIEAGGGMYTAWPTASGAAPERRQAGRGQILPGAVALDDSPGRETLYLVLCPAVGEPPRCQGQGSDQPPRCQDGCAMTSFILNKVRQAAGAEGN